MLTKPADRRTAARVKNYADVLREYELENPRGLEALGIIHSLRSRRDGNE